MAGGGEREKRRDKCFARFAKSLSTSSHCSSPLNAFHRPTCKGAKSNLKCQELSSPRGDISLYKFSQNENKPGNFVVHSKREKKTSGSYKYKIVRLLNFLNVNHQIDVPTEGCCGFFVSSCTLISARQTCQGINNIACKLRRAPNSFEFIIPNVGKRLKTDSSHLVPPPTGN